MKQIYVTPACNLLFLEENDVIATSIGDLTNLDLDATNPENAFGKFTW